MFLDLKEANCDHLSNKINQQLIYLAICGPKRCDHLSNKVNQQHHITKTQ